MQQACCAAAPYASRAFAYGGARDLLDCGAYPGNAPACPEPQTLAFVPPAVVLANLEVRVDGRGWEGRGGGCAGRESWGDLGSGKGRGPGQGVYGQGGCGGLWAGVGKQEERARGGAAGREGCVEAGRVRGVQAVLVKGGGCDAWVKGQA